MTGQGKGAGAGREREAPARGRQQGYPAAAPNAPGGPHSEGAGIWGNPGGQGRSPGS
jgi:hypothetical protein